MHSEATAAQSGVQPGLGGAAGSSLTVAYTGAELATSPSKLLGQVETSGGAGGAGQNTSGRAGGNSQCRDQPDQWVFCGGDGDYE